MHELDANTIALWRLDDTQGAGDYANIRDNSGNTYDLAVTGTIGIVGGPGGVGRAKFFDNDYASHPHDAALDAMFVGECTIEGWFYPTTDGTVTYLWNYGSSGESLASNYLVGIQRLSSGNIGLFMEKGGSGTNISVNSTMNIPSGAWSHIAIAKEDLGGGSYNYHFYLNGALSQTIVGDGPTGGGNQVLYLGSTVSGSSKFTGAIGAQRWSDITRSAGEIAASYARASKDHAVDVNTIINLPMDELPDLLDEANLAHLQLTSGTDTLASSLIADGGKARTFLDTEFRSTGEWPPLRDAFLAAMQDQMTVEFWGRLGTDWSSANRGAWVWNDPGIDGGTPNYNFLSFDVLQARNARVFSEQGNGVNEIWDSTLTILGAENQWDVHHYAFTLVASGGFSTYELYIDGVLIETSDGADPSHDGGLLGYWCIGNGSGTDLSTAWQGQIDDMRVSNVKRSAAEILASYNAGVVTGGGAVYRMRGYDTNLARYVYWNSSSVDSTGTDYAGPGPLTDIVVSEKTA